MLAVFTLAALAFGQTPQTTDPPQTPTPAAAPAAAPTPPPSPWTRGGVDFYLLGDVYYDVNFNHPISDYNQLYNFNVKANQAHLNMAKFSMEKASGPVGFRVDLGYGKTFDIVGGSDKAPDGMKYLEQVYLEFRPSHMHGIQLDVGKFVTSAGAEVIETNANWNYSRSLLFAWAIPYYHLGVRATIPVTKTFSTGVQLVNGWNNVKDNNDGKTGRPRRQLHVEEGILVQQLLHGTGEGPHYRRLPPVVRHDVVGQPHRQAERLFQLRLRHRQERRHRPLELDGICGRGALPVNEALRHRTARRDLQRSRRLLHGNCADAERVHSYR